MKSMKSLSKSVLISSNVKEDQQKTIPLEKTSEVKATCYLREFWEYACNRHLSPKYVFQDFKKFFEN